MQYDEYGEVSALSPWRKSVSQELALRSTSTALVRRDATAAVGRWSGVSSSRSTGTEDTDDRPGDADDVDGVENVNAHSRLSSVAYPTGATMS